MATLYSKAKILGHPIHPMLVAFPIAGYVTTLVAFVVYAITRDIVWFRVGFWANVVGVIAAVVAAIPGLIDWAFGIPKHSTAKRVGLLHMALNLGVTALFAINLLIQAPRMDAIAPPAASAVVLSLIGVAGLLASGYLGWSLVQTYHVGVQLSRDQQRFEPRERIETSP
ncbi:MAG TPA: DUF2231 domain-containing protein [Polyangiaceae bacterium]|nr:DUF2231 domain-containing protein [Polyangiaceae bacterium]